MVVSLFMAFSTEAKQGHGYLLVAIVLGLLAGWGYANNLTTFSHWFNGVGQEIIHSVIHVTTFLCLLVFSFFNARNTAKQSAFLKVVVGIAVVLAISRESAEIMLYISGFTGVQSLMPSVIAGSLIGLGLGLSVGVFLYYLMISLSGKQTRRVIHVLVVMVAGSMMAQATQMLIQADWLPSTALAWDSSGIISEHSLIGQLLYALMAYEATPTKLQVFVYAMSLMAMLMAIAGGCYFKKQTDD